MKIYTKRNKTTSLMADSVLNTISWRMVRVDKTRFQSGIFSSRTAALTGRIRCYAWNTRQTLPWKSQIQPTDRKMVKIVSSARQIEACWSRMVVGYSFASSPYCSSSESFSAAAVYHVTVRFAVMQSVDSCSQSRTSGNRFQIANVVLSDCCSFFP